MLLGLGSLLGPLQEIRLGDNFIDRVQSTRCLGEEIDCRLKWDDHVAELMKSFAQKVNLLRSLYFLPVNARADFYFKFFLPSVNYGLIVWGLCGKTLFRELELMHIRAAKIIYGLDWYTPGQEVLALTKWNTIRTMFNRKLLS